MSVVSTSGGGQSASYVINGQLVDAYAQPFHSAAAVATAVRSKDAYANGLLSGSKWSSLSSSFGFPTSPGDYEYQGEAQSGFAPVYNAQANAIANALNMVASVTGLTFTAASSPGSADLRFANSSLPSTAWGYLPSASAQGGDVWFNAANPICQSAHRRSRF